MRETEFRSPGLGFSYRRIARKVMTGVGSSLDSETYGSAIRITPAGLFVNVPGRAWFTDPLTPFRLK